MDIRKFTIENGDGNTIALADGVSKIFLNNPTGLGISNSISSNDYNEKLNVVSNTQNFNSIGGEMVFFDYVNKDKYHQYNEFVSFLMIKPLKLYYQIPTSPTKTYTIDIDVLSLDKTEIKNDGLLRCNFTFQTLSRWKGETIKIVGTSNTYEINNDGHMPIGFEIKLTGNLTNPYFTLSQNGDLYGEGKFEDGVAFSSVYVNSNDGEQSIELMQNDTILANPLSYQDLSISNGSIYVTFVRLAKGTSNLEIGMEGGNISNVEITYTPQYRSV